MRARKFAGPWAHRRVRSQSVPLVVVLLIPDRAKWAPQGPRRPKSVRSGRGHLGSISGRAMATCYLRGILSMQSENTLKMQGLEPSIHFDFRNGFFKKVSNLKTCF